MNTTSPSLFQKFKQLQGAPGSLARGTAVGVFIGIAPLMPFKSILILLFTVPTRSSTIAAFFVGTIICNPLTYIPLYYLSWRVGDLLLPGRASWGTLKTLIDSMHGTDPVAAFSLVGLIGLDTAVVLLIGGLAVALPLALVSYLPAHRIFAQMERKRYQKHVHMKKIRIKTMGTSDKMWKVGVIGTGRHGSRYARHITNDVDGLVLTAISRRSEKGRLQAEEWHCRWHADWRQLVTDPEVECVVATLPPVLNREVAEACAAVRKPLLLEKPMAVTAVDAEAINRLFFRKGVPLTIGQTLRYNRVIRMFRERIDSIGPLYSFTANQRLEPATLAWLDDPSYAGAGVSFHTTVHVFDAIRFITGREVVRVMARTRCLHSTHLEDHLVVLVELDNGVLGTIDSSKISASRCGRFDFVGGKGQLQGDQVHNTVEQINGQTRIPLDLEPPVGTIVPLLIDWLGFLRGTQPNPISGEEGLAAVRICAACLRSAVTGTWEDV